MTKAEILSNLKLVAGKKNQLTRSQYRSSKLSKFASSTIERTFGSFSTAKAIAKIK
jgi:hypothetical protein